MYTMINSNIKVLLDGINRNIHIDPYIRIGNKFKARQISTSGFRSEYRKFYQLNAARLSDTFCNAYFDYLEQNRNNKNIQIEHIVNFLYNLQSNSKGTHAVHFSFASKLVHTVNNDFPIYDSMIAAFYFLPVIKASWSKERKITEYISNYQFLRGEYRRIIDKNLLNIAIAKFREHFNLGTNFSDSKVIDTILWRFAAYLKSGAIRNCAVQYD